MTDETRNHDFLQYRPRIMAAVDTGDIHSLQGAVSAHLALAPMGSLASEMFLLAVRMGFWEGAQVLLDAGASLTRFDHSARTGLHYCARFPGDDRALALARTLIEGGCSVNHRSNCGNAAIVEAVHNGNAELFLLLREHGASLRASNTDLGQMLQQAIRSPFPAPTLEALLRDPQGGDLLQRGANAETLLHSAAGKCVAEACELLFQMGLRCDVIASNIQTPVHYLGRELYEETKAEVARERMSKTLDILLAHGGSLTAVDGDGNTPLIRAVHWTHGNIGAELLLDAGADINAVNKLGRSALHEAVNFNSDGAIAVLIERGIDMGIADRDGFTAEDLARHKDKARLADLLHTERERGVLESEVAPAARQLRGRI